MSEPLLENLSLIDGRLPMGEVGGSTRVALEEVRGCEVEL